MATPTWGEVWTQLTNAVKIFDDLRNVGNVTSPTLISSLDTYIQSLEGDAATTGGSFARSLRASFANLVASTGGMMVPHLLDLAKVILSDALSAEAALVDLYRYMNDNGYRIKSRAWSFGAIANGGSNVGNGTIYKLVFDQFGYTIESCHPTKTTFRCIQDSNSGSLPGREVFEVFQRNAPLDDLELDGSGFRSVVVGHAGDEILRNASFQVFTGTASAPTDIPNWSWSGAAISNATFEFSSTTNNWYRKSPEEAQNSPSTGGTPYGLICKATGILSQKIRYLGINLSFNVPYIFGIRWRRDPTGFTAGTGAITLRLGSNALATVAVAAQAGWETLTQPLPLTTSNWLKNFNENDLDFAIDITVTTNVLCIDDCFCGPMSQFDGLWYFAVGGATNWLREDYHTFTDTEVGSKVQREIALTFPGYYLPSAPAAPSALTATAAGAGAGNVNTGTHNYLVTFVDANSVESPAGAVSNTVTTDTATNGRVDISAVPLGPAGTLSRKIYRSATGAIAPYKLQQTIADNTTVVGIRDNTADGSLGATVNSLSAIADPS